MYEYLALSDNGFLFDTRTGHTYSLNPTGTFLLRQLMNGIKEESLADCLLKTYEVNREQAQRDVEQFLFRLKDLHLTGGGEE